MDFLLKKLLFCRVQVDDSFKHPVSDAAAIGSLIFVASTSGGVFIFELGIYNNLKMVAHYETFNQVKIYPISLSVDRSNGLLFVLDQVANIYVFRYEEQKLIAYDIIDLKHFGSFHVRSYKNQLFYSFVEGNSFKIAELYYDSQKKQAELIRYYKMFDYIFDFLVVDDSLLVFSTETMDVFPINIDPRMIREEHNGVRTPSQAKKAIRLIENHFLLCDGQTLQLVSIQKLPPTVECYFTNQHEEIRIQYRANSSSCHLEKLKYNSYCEAQQTMLLHIDIPEKGERQKIILYGVVLLFTILFVVGLMCLIQWRNTRLDWIDWITTEIKKYQSKEGNVRAFVEEKDQPGRVQDQITEARSDVV